MKLFRFFGYRRETAVIAGLGPVNSGGCGWKSDGRQARGHRRSDGREKKARLRKARRLLIVPFKTKVLNMFDDYMLRREGQDICCL